MSSIKKFEIIRKTGTNRHKYNYIHVFHVFQTKPAGRK